MNDGNSGALEIRRVSKAYDVPGRARLQVLSEAGFTVEPGAFVSIVGPSGCGKSTLLRIILGLDNAYSGEVLLHGEPILGASLKRGIVFQDHRLLPWLTLEQNVALALENAAIPPREKTRAIAEHIALVGLAGFEQAYPHQLSGGMAQRAAIARGLVNQPEILLLDEPLGALDALTRIRLQEELQRIWRVEGTSMILVTHDVEEALFLSSKVIVMNTNPGRVVKEIPVSLPHPRDRSSRLFSELRREIFVAMGERDALPIAA
ncbi:MAG: ABC transporter ATP-binding protein [Azoarcus sp.]|jgi:sulfonate transport system ATP-binding protein|nr:ABC transporter ATP-binding protein [Azoarcus sp.]